MTAAFDIDESMVTEIVGDVFTGLFGERYERPWAQPVGEPLPVSARVTVSGGWDGTVVFACTEPFALTAASELLGIGAEEVVEEDLRDVVGEFANVIGGNVKSVMPGPSALSIPQASLDGAATPDGAVEALRVDLFWQDLPLSVSIWKSQ